jgi:hypothetical protein
VHTGHIRKDVLKRIAIDTFIGLDNLDFELKCLSDERLAVEPQIVEICTCIIDCFQAISRSLVTTKTHSQSVAEIDEVVASGHYHKLLSSYLSEYGCCFLIVHSALFLSVMSLVEPFITLASALCECGRDTREQLVVGISVVVHQTAYPLATMGRVESFVLLSPLAVIFVAISISVLEIS